MNKLWVLAAALVIGLAGQGCVFGGDDDDEEEEIGCEDSTEICALPTGQIEDDATPPPIDAETTPVEPTAGPDSELFAGIEQDGMVLGDPDAEVEFILYEDFQCPFCARFTQQVLPRVVEDYVREGTVRIRFHPLAALGRESLWAAMAARCAADQGVFWEYYEVLFANQAAENSGVFEKSRLKAFGAIVGLDQTEFDACVDADTLPRGD